MLLTLVHPGISTAAPVYVHDYIYINIYISILHSGSVDGDGPSKPRKELSGMCTTGAFLIISKTLKFMGLIINFNFLMKQAGESHT